MWVSPLSPYARGLFCSGKISAFRYFVFSVLTGVILSGYKLRIFVTCCPRTHGGYSEVNDLRQRIRELSPYLRGLFLYQLGNTKGHTVFSVFTGVILVSPTKTLFLYCSPYTRGLFQKRLQGRENRWLLPVHTGVIPYQQFGFVNSYAIPRTHGGYSIRILFSLVVPIHTGVILHCPHR